MRYLIVFLFALPILAQSGPAVDPPAVTKDQQIELLKAQRNQAAAVANFNNAQFELQHAQQDMARAVAVEKAIEDKLCPGFDLDLSGDEPKCKAKPRTANGAGGASNPTPLEVKK